MDAPYWKASCHPVWSMTHDLEEKDQQLNVQSLAGMGGQGWWGSFMTVNVILEQVLIINIHTGRCLWAALYCHVFVSVFISWQINRRTLFLFFFPDGSWRTGKRRIDRVFLWPKKLATDIGTWHFKIGRSNGENNTKNSRCGPTYCMSLFHFFSLSDERIN